MDLQRGEEILVVVDADGGISVEVKGVKGKRCLELTEELEEILGLVQDRKKKPEFRLREQAGVRQKVGR